MSALADALVAAQRRAVAAIEKQYAAGRIEREIAAEKLDACGLTDTVDQERLLAALDTIMEYGASLPAEPVNGAPTAPQERLSSDAQKGLIDKLCDERGIARPNAMPRLFAEASAVIDKIKAGAFKPDDHPELYL